jgi:alanyl-tRNA synthetase
MYLSVNQIRQKFLQFFVDKQHTVVPSSSLVPHNDNTLLFTNAGMNQFKDMFLGIDKTNYVRATSVQKCVRAGGKHNDLENVGYTTRHHTFFEMLGNFSFGDYFKKEALQYAWQFLTTVLQIPADKLYVTVHDSDSESYEIWHKIIGLNPNKIIRIGNKPDGSSDNFWQMGDTGPCGPCSEIFYDHGEMIAGGLPGSVTADAGERYIEIWNCVFMQYNRDTSGKLNPLPQRCVDTGMGLERIATVLQNVHSNYEIDLFQNLINEVAIITNCKSLKNPSLKVIADHIRAISFLIADGVVPTNEGRGYVLRRIIRRAFRHGYTLGQREAFLFQLIGAVIKQMGDSYPELITNQQKISEVLLLEEQNFVNTITEGIGLLNQELTKLKQNNSKQLSGNIAFKLYDTYGFPLDLTADICKEHNIIIDVNGYDLCMAKQRQLAKASSNFKPANTLDYNNSIITDFVGYTESNLTTTVVALYKDNKAVTELKQGENGILILEKTPFYAESGGQVGDSGIIESANTTFTVTDTQTIGAKVNGHIGKVTRGRLLVGDIVVAKYDQEKRLAIAKNHSATHLLHKALHQVLGSHALQKGSLVCANYARFDFAHAKQISKNELIQIEQIVNQAIMRNYKADIRLMSYDDAIAFGAIALFGEKYDSQVSVLCFSDFSVELCGGTHVSATGDIGVFIIVSESGVASGIRRIEAITGNAAINYIQNNRDKLDQLKQLTKSQNNDVLIDKINNTFANNKDLSKQIEQLQDKVAQLSANEYLSQVKVLPNKVQLLIISVVETDIKMMQTLTNTLTTKLTNGIVLIDCVNDKQINCVIGVSKTLTTQYSAVELLRQLTNLAGGKGGGRVELAVGGGMDLTKFPTAKNKFVEIFDNQ